jgi:hypothetical protein
MTDEQVTRICSAISGAGTYVGTMLYFGLLLSSCMLGNCIGSIRDPADPTVGHEDEIGEEYPDLDALDETEEDERAAGCEEHTR